jgi:predicted AAA+ superfamily ATPase
MAELTNTPGAFVEKNFKALSLSDRTFSKTAVSTAIPRATFPQLSLKIKNKSRWCQSYISTLLERDVKNLSEIDRIEILPPLLSLLANRTGSLVNDAALALAAKVSQPTLKRYRTLLNGVFLTWTLPPWLKNLEKRLVKSPKIYFHDTMLLCHILGFAPGELAAKRPELYGFILENFAAGELNKELSRLEGFRLYHFRTSDQKEIDFIIEGPRGDILAVEVKGSSSVFPEDFRHIRFLEAAVKERFIRGIVLYQGDKAIQFDRKLFALPFPALWEL